MWHVTTNCTGKLQAYGIKALDFCHSMSSHVQPSYQWVNFSLETLMTCVGDYEIQTPIH